MNKAHVDLVTGKIYGCRKGSRRWWHEKGHLEYNKNERTSFLLLVRGYLTELWMIGVIVALLNRKFVSIPIVIWGVYTILVVHEENWCNKYAEEHCKECKEGSLLP
jgi:hypothetical protein